MTNHADLIAALRIPMDVTLRKGAPELDEYDEQRKAASDRIKELEAKLAKAVWALGHIESIAVHGGGEVHGVTAKDWKSAFEEAQDVARATLAEINGCGDT